MQNIELNKNFELAAHFVQYTNRNIFLTGKAGTGKTTFLKYIKEQSQKQMAVIAPTGVAAINAGGVTIHSFFQLPFTAYLPASGNHLVGQAGALNRQHLLGRLRINKERIDIFRKLELLIIDEVSMVRADVLDAIDTVLQHNRNQHHQPFGGVQVVLIGDMFQLPPVVQNDEWAVLSQVYKSIYFFDSTVLQQANLACVELNKIYRQADEQFINLLNKVRNNDLDEDAYQLLNNLYHPQFNNQQHKGYITLTTHNNKADVINNEKLQQLQEKSFVFKAMVEGDFGDKSFPADEDLVLKKGAQVMFIKNDTDKAKRYFNGKIGTINFISSEEIFVQCEGETESIKVAPHTWENIKYSFNQSNQKVEEDVVGSFKQYPLRLAWAITIHKSQGLTFDKAIIDAGQAFAPGQVYVALSRCRSLEGIKMLSRIYSNNLFTDKHIANFSLQQQQAINEQEVWNNKKEYQQQILMNLFDEKELLEAIKDVEKVYNEHQNSFTGNAPTFLENFSAKANQLQSVAIKFQQQIQQLSVASVSKLPEEDELLQQRIIKATAYFLPQLKALEEELNNCPMVTDSNVIAKVCNTAIKEIFICLSKQQYLLQGCAYGFTTEIFLQHKLGFTVPSFTLSVYSGKSRRPETSNSPHPVLYRALRELRDDLSIQFNEEIYLIAATKTIEEMVAYLPLNIADLKKMHGFGEVKAKKYGEQFIEVIQQYCTENNLQTQVSNKPEKVKKPATVKNNTSQESFDLFMQGKTIQQIAEQRNLTAQTIEGHLSKYVATGEIAIEKLIPSAKIKTMEGALQNFVKGTSITPIKEQLGNDYSYGELRMVLNWMDYNAKQQSNASA